MQKTVKIVVGKTLERPPLNSCDLLSTFAVDIINFICKKILLLTKTSINPLIVLENITSHIISKTLFKQQHLEITGKFLQKTACTKKLSLNLLTNTIFLVSSSKKYKSCKIIYFYFTRRSIHKS